MIGFLLLSTFIIAALVWVILLCNQKRRQGFEVPSKDCVVLFGDSILRNDNYVHQIDTVEYALRAKLPSKHWTIQNFAEDGALISDFLPQTENLASIIETQTFAKIKVVISIGGNDILNLLLNHQGDGAQQEDIFAKSNRLVSEKFSIDNDNNKSEGGDEDDGYMLQLELYLRNIFQSYENVMETFMQETTHYVHSYIFVSLYYPTDPTLIIFSPMIRLWNTLQESFLKKEALKDREKVKLLKLENLCNQDSDFVYFVEPSAECANKLGGEIASMCRK